MSDVQQDLDGFYQFASREIVLGHRTRTLSELFDEWNNQQLTAHDIAQNALAVQAALRDIAAGEKGQDFETFAHEFRSLNRISNDA